MEAILDLYAEPYQPAFPVICFDEVPYQMVSETQLPLPMQDGNPLRYDFEYRREGTCNLFMFLQPLAGWRHVKVTNQRTKQDFAWCMKDLVEIHFPQAEKIRVVLDNLNTHSPAAFYEAFPPEQARQLTRKLEFQLRHLSGYRYYPTDGHQRSCCQWAKARSKAGFNSGGTRSGQ